MRKFLCILLFLSNGIFAQQPDFIIFSVSGPTTAIPGQTVSVTVQAYNNGGNPTEVGSVILLRMILSLDQDINLNDPYKMDFYMPITDFNGGVIVGHIFNYLIPANINPGTYFWGGYVDAGHDWIESNENNNAEYGNTVVIQSPINIQPPVLTSPPDNQPTCDPTPDLTWTATGASYFQVQIAHDNGFNNIECDSTINSNNCTPGNQFCNPLLPGIYYWRVKSFVINQGSSNWSSTRSFTVNNYPPMPPTLIGPTGPQGLNNNITFSWNPSSCANRYRIKICTNPSMSSSSEISGSPFEPPVGMTAYTVGGNIFSLNQTYYWQVSGILYEDFGGWGIYGPSTPASFYITQQSLQLNAPSDGSTVQTEQLSFSWASLSNIDHYELYVDNNSGFGSSEVSKQQIPELVQLTNNSYTLSANWLTPNQTYYWKVKAFLNNGTSVESEVRTFGYAPPKLTNPDWKVLYRVFNPDDVDHFYTTSLSQLDTAIQSHYIFEGVEGALSLQPFETDLSNPMKCVYRLYRDTTVTKARRHLYTTDDAERDNRIIQGWKYEGISGYTYSQCKSGLIKLYHLYLNKLVPPDIRKDNFYTTSELEKNNAVNLYNYTYIDYLFVSSLGEFETTAIPWADTHPSIGDGVNPVNGNFSVYSKSSFDIPTGSLPLSLSISYNSFATRLISPISNLGKGWSHNYSSYLVEDDCSILVFWADGEIHEYPLPTQVNMPERSTTKGVYDLLTKLTSSKFEIKKKDQTSFTFEKLNNLNTAFLTSIKDRNNNATTLAYNSTQGKLLNVRSQDGRRLIFTYKTEVGKENLLDRVTDTLSRYVSFAYDRHFNLISFTDAQNLTTHYKYDTLTSTYDHLLNQVILPAGNIITNHYDLASGRIDWQKTGQQLQKLTLSLPSSNTTTATDELGKTIAYATNGPNGSLISKITSSSTVTLEYDDPNNPTKPTKLIDGNNKITQVKYDLMGNDTIIIQPLGAIHRYQYNAFNDITKYTDPLGGQTNYIYLNGRLKTITNPRGTTELTYYTNGSLVYNGLLQKIANPLGTQTSIAYNGFGNITSLTDNLSNTTTYQYDAISRLKQTSNANGQTQKYDYRLDDLLKSRINANNDSTKYEYTDNAHMRTVSDALNHKTRMHYNELDQVDSITNALNNKTRFTYWENGTVKSKIKPDGVVLNYSYDASNRLSQVSSGTFSRTYTYDGNDNITKINETTNGDIFYTYDDLNRLKTVTDIYGKTVSYTYALSSNVTRITYPGSNKDVDYTYYDDNLIHTVKDWNNHITSYTYRDDGSIDSVHNANNTYCKYKYDIAGRLIGLGNFKSNGDTINSYSYQLNALGNQVSCSQKEPLNFAALSAGTTNYSYNAANRMGNAGSATFQYDNNGNLINKNDNGNTNFNWDAEDRLINISGQLSGSLTYDALGNRCASSLNGQSKRYVLDINAPMSNVLMETDISGNVINYYVYGLGLVARIKADGITTHYYHFDSRGSTIAMTIMNQAVTHKYNYGPFGESWQVQEQDFNPFRYVGAYGVIYEDSTLYFMRARYYSPKTGRFLSEDPVWDENLYCYAENNPILKIDPTGKFGIQGIISSIVLHSPEFIFGSSKAIIYNLKAISAYYKHDYKTYKQMTIKADETQNSTYSNMSESILDGLMFPDIFKINTTPLVGMTGRWMLADMRYTTNKFLFKNIVNSAMDGMLKESLKVLIFAK